MEVKKKIKNNIFTISDKKIKCPTCKKYSLIPFTPFCSKKCSDLDLLQWLSDDLDENKGD